MMRRSFVNTQHGSETQHSAAGILDSVPSSLRRAIRRRMRDLSARDLSDAPEVGGGTVRAGDRVRVEERIDE